MQNNYLIEFRQVGNVIKVSAIDPVTTTEASIVVPAGKGLSRKDMSQLAIKRLEFVLKKKAGGA